MKIRNYKHLLEQMNTDKQIIITISLWTYMSKRMTYRVDFNMIKDFLDGDMLFKYGRHKVTFTTITGNKYSYYMDRLRIAKVDYIEMNEQHKPIVLS